MSRWQKWWKPATFGVIVVSAVVFALWLPHWGSWPPYGAGNWVVWKTHAARCSNVQVLTSLLAQNREEVRFWQGILFNVSLGFIGSVLGILSIGLKARVSTDWLRLTYTIAVVFLCAFYVIFVKFAEIAIAVNHHDLIGVQIALKLSKEGAYIQGQPFYDHSEAKQRQGGERLIKWLMPFGVGLTVLSVSALLFLPIPSQQRRGDPGSLADC